MVDGGGLLNTKLHDEKEWALQRIVGNSSTNDHNLQDAKRLAYDWHFETLDLEFDGKTSQASGMATMTNRAAL